MTEKLVERSAKESGEKVEALARMIATEAPQLEDLTEEQLQRLADVVVAETLKDDLKRRADQARISYPGSAITSSSAAADQDQKAPRTCTAVH